MQTFERGRNFAAWLGLVPVQHSTAGKQRLGRTSKMGQRDIRRLHTIGSMALIGPMPGGANLPLHEPSHPHMELPANPTRFSRKSADKTSDRQEIYTLPTALASNKENANQ